MLRHSYAAPWTVCNELTEVQRAAQVAVDERTLPT
jgi:hypothetical protein